MISLTDTTHATFCVMAFYSSTATAPRTLPVPLPLFERARWSVAGHSRRYVYAR